MGTREYSGYDDLTYASLALLESAVTAEQRGSNTR